MNTHTYVRIAIGLSLLAMLASCAPAADNDVHSYQTETESTQASIIGGTDATLAFAQQNGIVGIYDQSKGGTCTGSLIGPNLVLTAGHCINLEQPEELIVFFGTNFQSIVDQAQKGDHSNIRFGTKVARHEKFGSGKGSLSATNNDIGLIMFEGKAPKSFQLAKLASEQLSRNLRKGDELSFSGYGLNKVLKNPETGLTVVSEGAGLLRKVDKIKILSILATGEEITLDQSKGRGSCHGDSGGPAFSVDKLSKKNVVVGITSRGNGNCDNIVVYTAVMGYAKWISQKSKQLLQ